MKAIKIIIYGLGGFLLAGIAFFLFSFAYTSLESMSAQNVQSRLEELRRQVKQQSQAYEQWINVEKEYDQFKSDYMMKADQFDAFKHQLQNAFRKNGLKFSRLDYSFKSKFSDVVTIFVGSEFSGTYENIKRFLFEMESKDKLVLLKRIELNKSSQGNLVEGELAMEVYFGK